MLGRPPARLLNGPYMGRISCVSIEALKLAQVDDEGLCADVLAGPVDVNKPDGMGYTALHLACVGRSGDEPDAAAPVTHRRPSSS